MPKANCWLYLFLYCCHSQVFWNTTGLRFPLATQTGVNDPNDVLSRTFKATRKGGFFLLTKGKLATHLPREQHGVA